MIRNMSYDSADKACNSIGGILASIHNDEEAMFLASFSSFGSMYPNNPTTQYPKQVFIGLFDPFHNQVWTWKDGTPVNYTNWEPNQPDNGGGKGQYCGSIASTWTDSSDFYRAWRIGGWDDEYCDYPLDSICQKKASHTI
uniref:C-type lectin domain-containing protein n=1 Tax=Acrobeloides nanus TaxID=290746 RepID=A0A914EFC4_9BILA